jgi:hypothetical protein
MFEYLGLALCIFSWLSGYYLVRKWRGTNAMSLSLHASSNKVASKLFTATLLALGAAFYLWLIVWFVPHLNLSRLFTTLLTITILCLFVAAIVPDRAGWQRKVHRIAAYAMAYLFLPLGLLILIAPTVSTPARAIGIICLAYMLVSSILIWTWKLLRESYLVLQSVYIVTFQMIILSAAYL